MLEVNRSTWASDGKPEVPAAGINDRARLGRVAKTLIAARLARTEHLPPNSVGEPAWDILLALYAAHADQTRLRTTEAADASGIPQTTAFRWIDHLVSRGLISRAPVPFDKRCSVVDLSDEGVAVMERILRRQLDLIRELCGL